MMLFDSHAHINETSFTEEERRLLIEEIKNSDVEYVMDIGYDLESSVQAVKDAYENSWCYAVIGVHPHDTKNMDDITLGCIRSLANKEKVQAIGEIGLDYHYDGIDKEAQQYWFRKQIQLANELKLPIVIHERDASLDTMTILKEEGAFSKERQRWFPVRKDINGKEFPDSRVLLHCFSGSSDVAWQYVKLGGTISIAGPVTFKNNRKTIEVVKEIPIELLLVETDMPYLTPEPFRGKKNKSPYVEYTAKKIAEIKDISFEEVARRTLNNAKLFFNIE